jgi:hypothetical protein
MNKVNNIIRTLVLVVSAFALSGCISPRSFVDPQYHKAGYDAIKRLAQPIPVKLEVQFQCNGIPKPAVNPELRSQVERALRATGVFVPTTDTNASVTISVTANNIADIAAARAKGFGTGLTFGAAGTMVDDNYEFHFSFRDGTNHEHMAVYLHAIHTAIGNTHTPPGQTPTTPADAFGRVVEDVVLNFVKELQDAGFATR